MDFEPIEIVGVVADRIGKPTSDGSAGSGLYSVPIQLSRPLRADEASLLVELWDRPPSFTTMHRPGTAHASGDMFVLERTTIEEVEQYHAKTMSSIVEVFNVEVPKIRAAEDAEQERQRASEDARQQHVKDVADRIKFD